MSQFTASQIATLNQLYAEAGDSSIPGTWIAPSSLLYAKAAPGEFATGAQGSLADSAVQPGDNVSDLVNDAGYLASVPMSRFDKLVAAGGETELVLTATPVGAIQVFYKAAADAYPRLWIPTVDFTLAVATITFVTVSPLVLNDQVHVYFMG